MDGKMAEPFNLKLERDRFHKNMVQDSEGRTVSRCRKEITPSNT
jgi:hypothetical protein